MSFPISAGSRRKHYRGGNASNTLSLLTSAVTNKLNNAIPLAGGGKRRSKHRRSKHRGGNAIQNATDAILGSLKQTGGRLSRMFRKTRHHKRGGKHNKTHRRKRMSGGIFPM